MTRTDCLAVLAASPSPPSRGPGTAKDTASSSTRRRSIRRPSSPQRLVIRFNSRLESASAPSRWWTAAGRRAAVRQEDEAAPDTLIYPLPDLKPGPYRAKWKVLAADGHVTEGAIVFTVEAGAPAKSRGGRATAARRLIASLAPPPCSTTAWTPPAGAHAVLVRSTPPAARRSRRRPNRVQLWFNERLDRPFSSVSVWSSAGTQVDPRTRVWVRTTRSACP